MGYIKHIQKRTNNMTPQIYFLGLGVLAFIVLIAAYYFFGKVKKHLTDLHDYAGLNCDNKKKSK